MTTAAASVQLKRYPNLKFQRCFLFFYLVLLQFTAAKNASVTSNVTLSEKDLPNFAMNSGLLDTKNGVEKVDRTISSTERNAKESNNLHDYTDNQTVKYFSQEKLRLKEYRLAKRTETKLKKSTENNHKKLCFYIGAKLLKDINAMEIDEEKNQKKKSAIELVMDTVTYVVCALSLASILVLNSLYLLYLLGNNGLSKVTSQNCSNFSSLSQMTIMALTLLLFHVPVGGDVTVSQGTYFQNGAQGRYLQGYVIESFSHISIFQCQIQCINRLPICRSMNYIENEDGSSICEINKESQNCALPGEYILREKSFYLETMPETDDEVWCSTCSYRGVIVNTNEQPGFACSCKAGFCGGKCQDDVNECATNPCHANATCNNTLGSFSCACNTGFTGDGLNCTDDSLLGILFGKPKFRQQIEQWLPVKTGWHLCYRATKDGWAVSTFHSGCDNKGATVTIVRVGEYIFGGYNDLSWTGSNSYKSSWNAFLFSLRNKDNLKPFKAPVYRYSYDAIYDYSSYGPIFGGGNDLRIVNNAHSSTSSFTNLGYTYQPPSRYSYGSSNTRALLAGSYHFTPSEVEVFYFG